MAARTWLAVILACLVWFTYVQWFAPPMPQRTSPQGATSTMQSATPGVPSAPQTASDSVLTQGLKQVATHTVNTQRYQVQLSSVGGKISDVALKDYQETIRRDSPEIRTVKADGYPLALATLFTDPSLQGFTAGEYSGSETSGKYVFSREEKTAKLTKEYDFSLGGYSIGSRYKITFLEENRTDWGFVLIPVGASAPEVDHKDPLKSWEVVAFQNESLTRKAIDSLAEGETVQQGNTQWVGYGNRYFATVLVNESALNPDIVFVHKGDFRGAYLRFPLQLKAGQKEIDLSVKIYSGPKEMSELSKVTGLRRLIDYGTFSFLAFPMLQLLQFFYKFIHNYGIAIILLTIVVRALLYPLSVKGSRSMKAMQKLQPQIQALKEKYKDAADMQRFNQEQMALFKAHNVNPLGGCFPMLIQLPVFIALYQLLGNSIELFHAPFLGWVQDLSSKDPYYVYPVLMGIAMFVQQRMTPMAGMDPMQQKMMMLMPVIFSFMMVSLPSGLTLYIFVSTILGIVQQMLINRETKEPSAQLVSAPSPDTK